MPALPAAYRITGSLTYPITQTTDVEGVETGRVPKSTEIASTGVFLCNVRQICEQGENEMGNQTHEPIARNCESPVLDSDPEPLNLSRKSDKLPVCHDTP